MRRWAILVLSPLALAFSVADASARGPARLELALQQLRKLTVHLASELRLTALYRHWKGELMSVSERIVSPRIRWVVVTSVGLLVSSTLWVGAAEFTVFGPRVYERSSGPPEEIVDVFPVTDSSLEYTLRILNSGLTDSDYEKVSSSVIRLNGQLIIGPDEFNPQVSVVEAPIQLSADNQLSVEVRGKPGGAIELEIVGQDADFPTITARIEPTPNPLGWNNSEVTVFFDCQDATSGIAFCTGPVTLTGDGAGQTVEGVAEDLAGNRFTLTVVVNIDRTPPEIQVSGVSSGECRPGEFSPSVACLDPYLDEQVVTVDDFPFSPGAVIAEEGLHLLRVECADLAENVSVSETNFVIDQTSPQVSIEGVDDGAIVSSNVTLTIAIVEPNLIQETILLDGTPYQSGDPVITEGTHRLSVEVIDCAENTTIVDIGFTIDKTSPALSLVAPVPGSVSATEDVELLLSYSDNVGVDASTLRLEINGVDRTSDALVLASGASLQLMDLADGIVEVSASIRDLAGNESSQTETFTVAADQATGLLRGTVADSHDQSPLDGVLVELEGAGKITFTESDGSFVLENTPGGAFVLVIDGTTRAGDETYPKHRIPVDLIAGAINELERPVFLPALNLAEAVTIDADAVDPATGRLVETLVVENTALAVEMTVPEGTLITFPDGRNTGDALSITEVPVGFTPRALPEGMVPPLVVSIQPAGTSFDPPLPIAFPDLDGFADGSQVNLWSLDDPSGEFFVSGTGIATNGRIESVGGAIRTGSWHFPLPDSVMTAPANGEQSGNKNDRSCPGCEVSSGSAVGMRSGSLRLFHELPSRSVFGQPRSPRLVYFSERAHPFPILKQAATVLAPGPLPDELTFDLTVNGIPAFSAPLPLDPTFLVDDADQLIRQGVTFDASFLATGSHPYSIRIDSIFPTSQVATFANGRVTVDNGRSAPFGVGWGLESLSRLHTQPGRAVLTEGNGTALVFEEAPAAGLRLACGNQNLYVLDLDSVVVIDGTTGEILTTIGGFLFPLDIAISPDSRNLYVANSDNTVSVIDTSINLIVATVNVGSSPDSIAIPSDGSAIYVLNNGSDNVSVLDPATNTVVNTIPTGRRPAVGVFTSDDATLFIVNRSGDSVSVIDTAAGVVTETVPVGDFPHAAIITPDGGTVYVMGRTISAIDTSTNMVVATIDEGSNRSITGLDPLAVLSDGSALFAAINLQNEVLVIDTSTHTVIDRIPVGASPNDLAVLADDSAIFVMNRSSDDVSVIDVSTSSVSSTIPVGSRPSDMELTPDGRTIYVSNSDSNSVSVIDTETAVQTGTISEAGIGEDPAGVVILSDGSAVYVRNQGSASVSVIDPVTNDLLGNLSVGRSPWDLAAGNDDRTVWVANAGDDSLSIIDTALNEVVGSVDVGDSPEDLVLSPAGDRLWVVNRRSSTISVLDTVSNVVLSTVAVGSDPAAAVVAPDGGELYVATGAGELSIVDTTSLAVSAVELGVRALNLTITPDGSKVYVTTFRPDQVVVVDVASRAVVATLVLGDFPSDLVATPDGSKVYVGNVNSGTVSVIDVASDSVVNEIPVGGSPIRPVLSPDGDTLFISNFFDGTVSVIDTTTDVVRATVEVGFGPERSTVTPDGRFLYVPNANADSVSVIDTAVDAVVATLEPPRPYNPFAIVISPDLLPAPSGEFISPPGDPTLLRRDDLGTPADPTDDMFVRTFPDGATVLYDAAGFQSEIVDRNGNTTTYAYDSNELLTSVIDPTGRAFQFGYDAGGKLQSISDSAGRRTDLVIDGPGNLVEIRNPDGTTRRFEYDGRHLAIAQTDERGFSTAYEYDSFGRIRSTIGPDGGLTDYAPGDVLGLLGPAGDGPAPPTDGNEIEDGVVSPTGGVFANETNRFGELVRTIDPLGAETRIERDADGLPTSIVRPDGSVLDLVFDGRGNLLSSTERGDPDDPGDDATTFLTYDADRSLITSITDPNGHRSVLEYDDRGNLIRLVDPDSVVSELDYEARGLIIAVREAVGTALETLTTFEYDAITGDLLATTDALGRTTSFEYDQSGNQVRATDALGRTVETEYDVLDRLTTVTDALGGVTTFSYDERGNLLQVVDANTPPGVFSFEYNARGQVTRRVDPTGKSEVREYDAIGSLVRVTDRAEQVTILEYDLLGQLVRRELPGGQEETFAYDPRGSLSVAENEAARLDFTYDLFGRIDIATSAVPGLDPRTLDYGYDRVGNRVTMNGPGIALAYEYDVGNRLVTLRDEITGDQYGFTYDALGRRTHATLPFGIGVDYEHDAASQLTSVIHEVTAGELARNLYEYDEAGNVRLQRTLTSERTFEYDDLDRLTAADPLEQFSYDAVGNLDAESQMYDSANRLREDPLFVYEHDDNGNLMERRSKLDGSVTLYEYDGLGRFVRWSSPVTVAEYAYDALGRRVRKSVNGVSSVYFYDFEDIVQEVSAADTVSAGFTHGPGVDEPLGMQRDGARFVYLQDRLGSVIGLADDKGVVVNAYDYTAFGGSMGMREAVSNPYGFTGRERDPETGLQFFRARYYDPTIGRFLSEDPLGLSGGVNAYQYVRNNPLTLVDPFGLDPDGENNVIEPLMRAAEKAAEDNSVPSGNEQFPLVKDPKVTGKDVAKDFAKNLAVDKVLKPVGKAVVKFAKEKILGTDDSKGDDGGFSPTADGIPAASGVGVGLKYENGSLTFKAIAGTNLEFSTSSPFVRPGGFACGASFSYKF